MGGSSSTPVPSDAGGSAAIVTQAPTGCPVQHSPPAPDRTSKPSISECPVHQDSMVKLQASQCPISAGSGCDSAAIDKGADALDPANMVKLVNYLELTPFCPTLEILFLLFFHIYTLILKSVL